MNDWREDIFSKLRSNQQRRISLNEYLVELPIGYSKQQNEFVSELIGYG